MPDHSIFADGADPSGQMELRVSDADREYVVGLLREHATVGRLTFAELDQRAERAYSATTGSELAKVLSDLPRQVEPADHVKRRRWLVSVLGSSNRRIRHRVRRILSVAVLASPDIDLCHAELDGDEIIVKGFVLWGWPDIYVPDSVGLELTGFTLMGGDEEKGSTQAPPPGAPVVKVRSYGLIGGYTVWRLPPELQGLPLSKARKAAKELPRGAS
jgi:hypothetical protein